VFSFLSLLCANDERLNRWLPPLIALRLLCAEKHEARTTKIRLELESKKCVFGENRTEVKVGRQTAVRPGANPATFEFTATTPAL
jgi:hypothetical protein